MTAARQITIQDSSSMGGSKSVELSGKLDFESVPSILSELQALVRDNPSVSLSLGGVVSANSSALALLLELQRTAQQSGHSLNVSNLPDSVLKIAGVCEAGELLSIAS